MRHEMMTAFLNGAYMMALAIAGLAFAGFWKRSKDPLFAIFAIAFSLLAAERFPLVFLHKMREHETFVYLFRLVAFLLIIVGILHKNRKQTPTI